ncbi:hypothetical protein BaRGS_00026101 [Batillaria attramentaria]|uniref:Uncharacterized protein n=1 Tax=Batillaria attramentaria TaxID=370345 RepID=A0ABD0K5G9_9CAEN
MSVTKTSSIGANQNMQKKGSEQFPSGTRSSIQSPQESSCVLPEDEGSPGQSRSNGTLTTIQLPPRSQESLLREFIGMGPIGAPEKERHVTSKVMLQQLYTMLPDQLCSSYRSTAVISPGVTAEQNLRLMKELYPSQQQLHRVRAAGIVVETVHHLKKMNCNILDRGGPGEGISTKIGQHLKNMSANFVK